MTLECMVFVFVFGGEVEKGVVRVVRVGVEVGERRCAGRDGRDAGTVVCFGWKVEAAAKVRPKDERRGARRKAEENSVLAWGYLGVKFWVVGDFMFGMVYSACNAEVSDLEWR